MTRDMRRLTLDFSVAGKLWMTVNHVKCISSKLVCVYCIVVYQCSATLRWQFMLCDLAKVSFGDSLPTSASPKWLPLLAYLVRQASLYGNHCHCTARHDYGKEVRSVS